MKIFENFTGVVAPLNRKNIDTDAIIPKQYLKSIQRTGFGKNLFDSWRYLDKGEPGQDHSKRAENPDFILNQEPYRRAKILLVGENFGCGSSREHAVWSLLDYGINTVIAASFANIFYNNAFKNGLLLITFNADVIEQLFQAVYSIPACELSVDLDNLSLTTPASDKFLFKLDPGLQTRLLQGLDDIAMTLDLADKIKDYETRRRRHAPWLFTGMSGL